MVNEEQNEGKGSKKISSTHFVRPNLSEARPHQPVVSAERTPWVMVITREKERTRLEGGQRLFQEKGRKIARCLLVVN